MPSKDYVLSANDVFFVSLKLCEENKFIYKTNEIAGITWDFNQQHMIHYCITIRVEFSIK